jgi:hypothetical protein
MRASSASLTMWMRAWIAPPAAEQEHAVRAAVADAVQLPPSGTDLSRPSAGIDTPMGSQRSYWGDLLWTFLFPANPHNLAVWIGFWVLMGLMTLLSSVIVFSCFALVFAIVFWGLYCIFGLQTIEGAAAGDDHLPMVRQESQWFYEMALALFKWIGSYAIVLLPAIVYGFAMFAPADLFNAILPTGMVDVEALRGQNAYSAAKVFTLVALAAAGIFLWPMVILCVALGGFSAAFRLDLIFATIVRAFLPYLATVGLVYGAMVFANFATWFVGSQLQVPQVFAEAIVFGVSLYVNIVSWRVIGLFYHHFKRRFAWSWG